MLRSFFVFALLIGGLVSASGADTASATSVGRIAFVRSGDLWTIRPDGSGLRRVTRTPNDLPGAVSAADSDPEWSPGGRWIAFTRTIRDRDSATSSIHVVRPDGRRLRLIATDGRDPTWSPDGARIAFVDATYGTALRVANVRRPQVATVLEGCPGHFEGCDFQFGAIDWSPTTDSIAATVADPGGWDVWFFRTDGTFIERPWPHDDDEWSAVWSPRATWLAVIRDTLVSSTYTWERTYRLEMVRPDGSARQTVSVVGKVVPETDALPPLTLRATWGPWGRLLAFSTPTGRIYVIRRDGTRKRFLTRGTQPDWKPFPLPIEPPHGPCLPGYPCP